MADMPEEIPVVNPVTDHALTNVAVDLLGTGADNHRIEFLLGSLVIDRDVLETTPDVLVKKKNNFRLPELVHLRDRFEKGLAGQGHPLVTNAFPRWSEFVTETFTSSAMMIMVPPVRRIGFIVDPIAEDGLGIQQSIADLFVDGVVGKEPPQVRRLERDELIIQVLEHSLGIEDVEEKPGVVSVPMEMEWQDLGRIEADWVVDCTTRQGLPTTIEAASWHVDFLSYCGDPRIRGG
jgi:hypothetical protein